MTRDLRLTLHCLVVVEIIAFLRDVSAVIAADFAGLGGVESVS